MLTADGATRGGNNASTVFSVYGVGVQHFVGPRFWLGGSVGAGLVTTESAQSETVLGLTARGGYNLFESGPHAFSISADLTAGFFEPDSVVGVGVSIGYQLM